MADQGRINSPPWGICDVCGFKHPLKNLRKRWDGLKVCREDFETRHPQDFVRGVPDNQSLSDPRPRPADVFIGPGDVTADDL